MIQVLVHLVGDYLLQNDWMASTKKRPGRVGALACSVHVVLYTLPFLVLTRSIWALLVILVTHWAIDRTTVISRVIWLKNQFAPKDFRYSWGQARHNAGYPSDRAPYLAVWLAIIVDNTVHLLINAFAIGYL